LWSLPCTLTGGAATAGRIAATPACGTIGWVHEIRDPACIVRELRRIAAGTTAAPTSTTGSTAAGAAQAGRVLLVGVERLHVQHRLAFVRRIGEEHPFAVARDRAVVDAIPAAVVLEVQHLEAARLGGRRGVLVLLRARAVQRH